LSHTADYIFFSITMTPGRKRSLLKAYFALLFFSSQSWGFTQQAHIGFSKTRLYSSTETKAPPRSGLAQTLLNFALASPLWKYVLVPQARATMEKTAEANGIPWKTAKDWLETNSQLPPIPEYSVPEYYKKAFHAYDEGNLSWDAALEVEIASCSVGARNFPQYQSKGEDAFRGAFESALEQAGSIVPKNSKMLDMGCGTGMSTRRLSKNFPQASVIQGIDLSPYFAEIGRQLLRLEPTSFLEGGPWVSTIQNDKRIEYLVGDAANTGLESASFDVVNLQFVLHELPSEAARGVVDEAMRVLKPNGQLWICEMDFEAPAYAELRANALLFSLIRATEPYLDDYAESISDLFAHVQAKSTSATVIPATGRHYALVATKGASEPTNGGTLTDLRFNEDGTYRVEDTHLKVWESKEDPLNELSV
jgi:ubiquinone/menaquinone biosynthesis C-methylase UbiE